MLGRTTRRALPESGFGEPLGDLLSKYTIDGAKDGSDTIGDLRKVLPPPIPAGPPTFGWTITPGSADAYIVAVPGSETVAVTVVDDAHGGVVDLRTVELPGTCDADDASRQPPDAEIWDGLIYISVGGTSLIVAFDRQIGDSVAFVKDDKLYDIGVNSIHPPAQTNPVSLFG